ncbi:MAG: hypothetical protein IJO20_08620 [Ruminococcus sp.]|nr:hypothetical protein [Ruminococcus sp.]
MKNIKHKLIAFAISALMICTVALMSVGATPTTVVPSETVNVETIAIATEPTELIIASADQITETQEVKPCEPTVVETTADETKTEKEPRNFGFFIGIGAIILGGLVATAIIGFKLKNREEEEEE